MMLGSVFVVMLVLTLLVCGRPKKSFEQLKEGKLEKEIQE
jgi:hypothetical protein